jgi:SAM-dependent methyltransferase
MSEYVLGADPIELARLRLQQGVWGSVTADLLDRVGIAPGARVLDAGCGPGLVTEVLRGRVGESGNVTSLDGSPAYLATLRERVAEAGWTNVDVREGLLESVELEPGRYDRIFLRWVLSFLPDPQAIVERLAAALAPGGVLIVQDYNHEGVSLFPRSSGFDAMIRATRALYETKGGDTWIAGRLPGLLRQAGLEVIDQRPNVICGGPDSPAFRWADSFFPTFSTVFENAGLVTSEEREQFLMDWTARLADPDAIFFSPIVLDIAARRPA